MNYLNGLKTLMIVAIAAVAFSSCSEDQTSLSINDIKGTAKLIGSFTYDDGQATTTSSSSSTTSEKPAANVKVVVYISNASLDPKSDATGYTTYETTTDAKGEYEIVIPAVETGTNITIQAAPFEGKHYYSSNSSSSSSSSAPVVKEGVYSVIYITGSVKPNDIIAVGKAEYGFTAFDESVIPYN